MHWIAVVQISVPDTAHCYAVCSLYYCDLSFYIIPYLTSFSPKGTWPMATRKCYFSSCLLPATINQTGSASPYPFTLLIAPHLLPFLLQVPVCSVQSTHATPGSAEQSGLCSRPCREDPQAAPSRLKSHRAPAAASQLGVRIAPLPLTAQDLNHVHLASIGPLRPLWVLGRSLQNGSPFSQSV